MLKLATKCAPRFEDLDRAYRAGFRHVEIYLDEAILRDGPAVLACARHFPHRYNLHFPNRPELSDAALAATLDLYRGLGCTCLVIHQPMFDRYQAELLRREPKLRLAIENHHLTRDGFAGWAEQSPGLTLDVEHLWMFTMPDAPLSAVLDQVRRFLERSRDRLRHVHLPGYWPGLDEHRPMYSSREFVFPVLTLLAEARFDGFVVSETSTNYQTDADLRMDLLLFERWRELHQPRPR